MQALRGSEWWMWHRQLGAEARAFPLGLTAATANGAWKIYSFNPSGNYIPQVVCGAWTRSMHTGSRDAPVPV